MKKFKVSFFKTRFVFIIITFILGFSHSAFASSLDKIIFQVSAEQWVQTTSANVIVQINATLGNQGLAAVRLDVLNNLNTIAKGEWHITQFDRSQDNSGLERLNITAEARLNENQLANLRDIARKVSKPGTQYTIQDIQFTPDMASLETARATLRQTLYNKIKEETTKVNQIYAPQQFNVYNIDFIGYMTIQALQEQKGDRMEMSAAVMNRAAMPATLNLAVGNRLQLTATVMLAATMPENRLEGVEKAGSKGSNNVSTVNIKTP